MTGARPTPVLVTGLPRSGTTWLARELTRAPGVALAGREPMNPRGHQFALSGSLSSWTRLDADASAEQRRTLRRVYQGREPRVYSRYGVRQWSAPLPKTQLVVKDPFALLSLPLVAEVTGAIPVVLFRHPGALLQSYRRMGWRPAVAEMQRLGLVSPDVPAPSQDTDPIAVMAWFWTVCYSTVLDDLPRVPHAVLIHHAELAQGGDRALRTVIAACDMTGGDLAEPTRGGPRSGRLRLGRAARGKPTLHNFERSASEVAEGWRAAFTAEEADRMEQLTDQTWTALQSRRLDLSGQQRIHPGGSA